MREELCVKLRELREENKLSQKEVADYVHVTRQAISQWEIGKTKPDVDSLKMLCELYNVSLDELLVMKTKSDESKEGEVKKEKRDMIAVMEVLIFVVILAVASQVPILGVIVSIVAPIIAFKWNMKGKIVILFVAIIALVLSGQYTYNMLSYYLTPDAGTATIEKL